MSSLPRQFGLWTAVALVVGNMIGSGLFLLPVALAPYGSSSLLGWLLSGTGALLLAVVFARLGLLLPHAGGPYVFVRAAFGDATGFLVAWGYWIAIWCGNAAIAIAFAGALQKLLPFDTTPRAGLGMALAAIWLCTAFNLRGALLAGRVQLLSTVLKLAPLLVLVLVAGVLLILHPRPWPAFQPDPAITPLQSAEACMALCLWALLGLESATVAASSVRDPERNVPRATLLGTLVAVLVTVSACMVVMLLVPSAQLQNSTAPFVDAAAVLWGPQVALLFAATAAIAAFGTLNGWILMQGQIPLAAARDGLFPQGFARTDAQGTPYFGLLIGSVLASSLVITNFDDGLVQVFTYAILLSTAATLVPYLLCSAALLRLMPAPRPAWLSVVCTLALLYSAWALLRGIGIESLAWGALLFLVGVPVYLLMPRTPQRAG